MLKIQRLLVNGTERAMGTGADLWFGWQLHSDHRNVRQQRYRLQLAEDPNFAALVQDTGWVQSDASAYVRPAVTLRPATGYYVRVQAADQIEETPWSTPVYFVTALSAEDWQAPFVTAEKASDKDTSKGTYLRGTFTVEGTVQAAYAFTTALGLYQFYLNGTKVGDDEMAPGWTSYRKHLLYQCYDVYFLIVSCI